MPRKNELELLHLCSYHKRRIFENDVISSGKLSLRELHRFGVSLHEARCSQDLRFLGMLLLIHRLQQSFMWLRVSTSAYRPVADARSKKHDKNCLGPEPPYLQH